MSGIAGTPAYMSPERLRGEGLSAAADLYSLGVLAYRVLTGGLPSSDETPSTVRERLAAARPDVPGHALDAVTAALSPTPGDRPPSAMAFSQLLCGRTGSAASSTDRPFTTEVSMFLEGLWRDVLYGARMLWQKPTYSAIAILTLALGIGANTAIFSVVNTVLLKPLPFAEPDRVMALGQQTTQNRAALSQFSFRNFADLRDQSQVVRSPRGLLQPQPDADRRSRSAAAARNGGHGRSVSAARRLSRCSAARSCPKKMRLAAAPADVRRS